MLSCWFLLVSSVQYNSVKCKINFIEIHFKSIFENHYLQMIFQNENVLFFKCNFLKGKLLKSRILKFECVTIIAFIK